MLYFSGLVVDCVVVFAVNGYIGVGKRLCCVVRGPCCVVECVCGVCVAG